MSKTDKADSPNYKFTARLKNALVNDELKQNLLVSDMPAKVQATFGKSDEDRLANPGEADAPLLYNNVIRPITTPAMLKTWAAKQVAEK